MTRSKRALSLLLAVFMILSVCTFTVAAEAGGADTPPSSGMNGLEMSKTYDPATGLLTLEAYVTGESVTTVVSEPVDIVLVLDVSGSMDVNSQVPYRITVGTGTSVLDVLDSQYGGDEGTYVMSITAPIIGDHDYKLRYVNNEWQYESIFSGWVPVIGSGYEDKVKDTYITKLNALKIATQHFIDSAQASSDPSNPNRISIVSYASQANTVMGLTDVTDTGAASLKSAVRGLTANGATAADYGMQRAETILASSSAGRKKVVVMFTDGEPNHGSGFDTNVANATISSAYNLKQNNTTVYTVGCFENPSTQTVNYMNYVSSNYPTAQSMTESGTQADTKYYRNATTSSDLTEIFEAISQETGGATISLTSTTVLKDVVSEYFDLPENAGDQIRVHTKTCTAIDASGKPTAWSSDNNYNQYTPVVSGKTITVSGFDYSANWVGSHSGQPGGKKLVIEIPIEDNGTGYGTVPTNTPDSGIYVDGENKASFEIPTVDYPYYILYHVRSTGVVEPKEIKTRFAAGETLTLTDKVSDGYLYGGGFTDAACTIPTGNGHTGFVPTSGATYYIWEVPNTYLRPKSMSLWEHKTATEVDVIGFYLMSVIDRLNYQSVGFDVTASNGASSSISDVGASGEGTVSATLGDTKVYESIHIVFKEGSNPPYKDVLPTDFDGNSSGSYLTCFDVPKDYWQNAGDTITFIPYWVTLDGVKVTGTLKRTCRYEGQGSDSAANNLHKMIGKVADDIPVGSICTAVTAAPALAARLSLRAAYVADGSQYTDPAPVDPVEPSDSTVAITVHDNGSVSSVTVKPGSVSLTYAGAAGMRFAGWFTDAACTVPADLTNVLSDMTVYAKYVSDSYLTVKYAERGWFRVTGISLVSAVDSRSYADTGFVINGEAVSATNYSSRYGFYTAGYLFGSGVDRNAPLMSYDYSLPSMSDGDTISVTPYWVTLDGTIVYGTTRTLTYYRFGLVG